MSQQKPPTGLPGLAVTLICLLGMLVLLGLGALIGHYPEGAIQRVDEAVLRWFAGVRTPWLDTFFSIITDAGSPVFLQPLGGIIALMLLLRKREREAAFLVLSNFGSSFLAAMMKLIIARPRPQFLPAWYPSPGSFSFPSIHAAQSVTFLLSLLVVIRLTRGRVPPLPFGAGAVLVILVCLSRLYLQVHFLSDVLAGMATACLWVFALAGLMFSPPVVPPRENR